MATLYAILARDVQAAVIFRRGPSRRVRLINWNLTDDTFELGQWFSGRIYERKSDLSPDGSRLVYFAAKYTSPIETWIAVSTPPFITAHTLWRATGTWNDLSLFVNDNLLALSVGDGGTSPVPEGGFSVPPGLKVISKTWPGHFYRLPDHDRMIRDGWSVYDGDPVYHPEYRQPRLVYRKNVVTGCSPIYLQLIAYDQNKWSYEVLRRDGGSIDLKAQWADTKNGCVFYSQGGKLFKMTGAEIEGRHATAPALQLGDFTEMAFDTIEAPYKSDVRGV